MRISVKFFLPNINTFIILYFISYYSSWTYHVPFYFRPIPILHKFIHANFSFEMVRETKCRKNQSHEKTKEKKKKTETSRETFQTTKESFKSKTRIQRIPKWTLEKRKKKKKKEKKKALYTNSKQLNGSRIISQVQGSVTGQSASFTLHPNSSTNLRANRDLVGGQRAVW